jgi:hypothetical protein
MEGGGTFCFSSILIRQYGQDMKVNRVWIMQGRVVILLVICDIFQFVVFFMVLDRTKSNNGERDAGGACPDVSVLLLKKTNRKLKSLAFIYDGSKRHSCSFFRSRSFHFFHALA